jgi:hypothetical protein
MFLAGLFASAFRNLSHRPLGFSADGLLAIDVVAHSPEPGAYWAQVMNRLRELHGVESAAISGWAPFSRESSWNNFVSINVAPPGPVLAYMLGVSSGWFDTMKMPLLAGRDFRPDETRPGGAIVNETFVREFLGGANPLGQTIKVLGMHSPVVEVVRDVAYKNVHEPILPVLYVPVFSAGRAGEVQPIRSAAMLVRTSNPIATASTLRREIQRVRPEFRVSKIAMERELVDAQTVRERLLSMLALFFAGGALLLAGIGLYGVLDYSVLQRRREIGIRIAIGARGGEIARRVTGYIFLDGSSRSNGRNRDRIVIGPIHPLAAVRSFANRSEDASRAGRNHSAAALLAAIPLRAMRIDPVAMLRAELVHSRPTYFPAILTSSNSGCSAQRRSGPEHNSGAPLTDIIVRYECCA